MAPTVDTYLWFSLPPYLAISYLFVILIISPNRRTVTNRVGSLSFLKLTTPTIEISDFTVHQIASYMPIFCMFILCILVVAIDTVERDVIYVGPSCLFCETSTLQIF